MPIKEELKRSNVIDKSVPHRKVKNAKLYVLINIEQCVKI